MSDYDWEWDAAGREFERAVALDPRNANARHWYSHYLTAMGRTSESLEHSERAIEISPYDIVLRQHLGWHYLFARDYEQALEALRLSREMDPGGHTTAFLALANHMLGRSAEAGAECERGLASTWRQDAFAMGFVGFVCARLGQRQEVLELAGGVLYTLGVIFHAWQRLRFQNAIWHGFVLSAASCHFAAVIFLVET